MGIIVTDSAFTYRKGKKNLNKVVNKYKCNQH
jgi:hypothetical protein